jgi:TonB family protein
MVWSPPLAYPLALFERGVEGRVVLQAVVDNTGRVEPNSVQVVRSTRSEFERPAIEWLRNSRFERSGRRSGPVRTRVRIPVTFDPKRISHVTPEDSTEAAELAAQAEALARLGNIENALAVYAAAQNIDGRLSGSFDFWYGLCWYGSLWGYAAEVLLACDQALALEPRLASAREARGLARAMLSDFAGAVIDLQEAAERATTEQERVEREAWLQSLRSGQNPFTEEVLARLKERT